MSSGCTAERQCGAGAPDAFLRLAKAVVALPFLLLTCQAAPPDDTATTKQAIQDLSELSLQELGQLRIDSVYSASKYEQKTTEAPASVTIITSTQIEQYGYRTLADILRSVRGFYITYDRNYSFLGVRGFGRPGDYNTRVLLMIDGHRVNDILFDGALLGTEFPLDVDLIHRVEIIRGPSSSLYGTSAFFGVINVITKRGSNIEGLNVSGELASFGTSKGRLTYGRTFQNGMEILMSSTLYGSDGQKKLYFQEFDHPSTNNGIAENADGDSFSNLFAKISYKGFALHALYGSRDKGIPTASFGSVFNDSRTRTIERRGYFDLQHQRTLKSGWDLTSRLYYDNYDYDGDYVFESSENDISQITFNRDFARGNWWGGELKARRKLSRRHDLTAGTEFRDNFRQDQLNYDEQPFVQHLDDRRNSKNWALYVQDEFTIHKKLILNAGLRFDRYDTFGGTVNPRLGLIYSPFQRTTIKLLYGEAFRAPSFYELFWAQKGASKANPNLTPETITTPELILEQRIGRYFQLSAATFHYSIHDLITQYTDPRDDLLVYRNLDRIRANGFELELEGKSPSGVEGRVSYAFQTSENVQTGYSLRNSPRHLGQFNVNMPLFRDRLLAGFALHYVGSRKTGGNRRVGSALVSDLTLFNRKLGRGFDLSASFHNLFDTAYAHPGSEEHIQDAIRQDGRSFRIKLTYRLTRGK